MGLILGQEDPLRRNWQPAPVHLPRESCGQEDAGGLQCLGPEPNTAEGLSSGSSFLMHSPVSFPFLCVPFKHQTGKTAKMSVLGL